MNSMIAIWVASMPIFSRSDGSEPPYPPSSMPFTANMTVTAAAEVRVARGVEIVTGLNLGQAFRIERAVGAEPTRRGPGR